MKRMKGKGFTIAAATVVFLVTFGLGLIAGGIIKTGGINDTLSLSLGKSYNILVMGIDAQNAEENSRSDTMILVSIDKKSKDIAMVWIPRDTRVETGNNRYNKINSINYVEGPEAAMQAVGELLDLKVDYYVTTNFGGFAKIIDILGGVHIDVPSDMKHYDPDPDLAINLSKGSQVLNGQDALRFVRYRGGPTADIGRTGRQQQFIKALADEMFSTKAVLKLPKLLPEIIENVHTNIPMKDMLYLAKTAKDFEQGNIITQTLPGYPYTEPKSGASYWIADEDIAHGIIKDLLAGKEFEVAQDPPQQTYSQVKTDTGSETDT
ncbi:MAG: LCP family protein, partial [Syntrophomonadaceae bacterium]|nr:LCP family protein [Syntrophomonadaceae bacterium]